jgi:hypothetical protein
MTRREFANPTAPSPDVAGVAELVDAQDLKSCGAQAPCGFKSRPRHTGKCIAAPRNISAGRFSCLTSEMTRIEQHKMIQQLREFSSKMKGSDSHDFEMLLKRDKDEEDLDAASIRRLEELYARYVVRKKKSDVEEIWKKLTGGASS